MTVVIPWREGCPHREAALTWTLRRWHAAGWKTIVGAAPDGPWCKATAVAKALPHVHSDMLVIADADVWCDSVDQALAAVQGGAAWAVPHRQVHRLTREATDAVLAGGTICGALDQPAYLGFEGGGLTVLRRTLYDQIPLDPRFAGWGQEDEAWALALRTTVGPPWRGTAPLYHLWHPPQPRQSRRWGSPASRSLWHRYRRASGHPEHMRALIADAVEVSDDVA